MNARTLKACKYCHKSKIKCSGTIPCYNCDRKEIECVYMEKPRKRMVAIDEISLTDIVTQSSTDSSADSELATTPINGSLEASLITPETPLEFFAPTKPSDGMILSSSSDPSYWDHNTLFNQKLPGQNGSTLSWIDVYYQLVYMELPILPRYVLEANFYHIPIRLLHAMFATSLLFSRNLKPQLVNYYAESLPKWMVEKTSGIDMFDIILHYHVIAAALFLNPSSLMQVNLGKLAKNLSALFPSIKDQKDNIYLIDNRVLYSVACRIFCIIYLHDFRFGERFKPPFAFPETDFPPEYLLGLEYCSQFDGPAHHLSYAKYFVPLRSILKAFVSNAQDYENIYFKLKDWKTHLVNLEPLSDAPNYVPMVGARWHSYLYLEYFYVKITFLQFELLEALKNDFSDPIVFNQYRIDVGDVCKVIRGLLLHNPSFSSVTYLACHGTFLAALILCALSVRLPTAIAGIDDLLLAVDNMQDRYPVRMMALSKIVKYCVENPLAAKAGIVDYFA